MADLYCIAPHVVMFASLQHPRVWHDRLRPLCCPALLCSVQYMPNVLVTAELLMSAAEQLPSFSSHSLSLLVWSLGLLRLKPNKEWMQLMLKQAQARFR